MLNAFNHRGFWLALALACSGCGAQKSSSAASAATPAVAPKDAVVTSGGPAQEHAAKPFSGEIVYRVSAPAVGASASRDLGELHYFISGAHWKHADASGATSALYEP